MVDAVDRYGRVWQTGSLAALGGELPPRLRTGPQRTHRPGAYRRGRPAVRATASRRCRPGPREPPPDLDYDFWLGPAPLAVLEARFHWNWRWQIDYGGGQFIDWVGHHLDIAHWGMGTERPRR